MAGLPFWLLQTKARELSSGGATRKQALRLSNLQSTVGPKQRFSCRETCWTTGHLPSCWQPEELGDLLVLVNNIGGNVASGLFIDSDPATWTSDIDLNLGTTLRMTHAALPGMRDRRAGRIINVGSTAGLVGDYMLTAYSAAKAAVHGFTKVLAKEVGELGITVNCVAPYGTISDDPSAYSSGSRWHPETGFLARSFRSDDPDVLAKRSRRGVLPRGIGRADEVAAAILYLASDQAAGFVTGQILQVDGGTLL